MTAAPERIEEGATVADDSSLMGRLRARREEQAANKTIDLPIPGYGGELVCRYRLLDPLTDGKEIGRNVRKQFPKDEEDRLYYSNLDTIVKACDSFHVRLESGDLVLLDPDNEGPMDYGDQRLHAFLGFAAESAREAVEQVFAGNRVAVNVHAQQLQLWMGDTSGELNQGILGA